ncbi:hypothetical protein OVA03_09180 [Asticcacaulis sp. SL142]|uniref:hypothetical protein n=1 Tax=Asticcacaulis sp. SL142 TaxID=2995155 RepID=UPI00226C666D|nr:hypothetical protein [Asticcacaulis sp. SL142]WAC46889.1 hypothetical protein OVA03_09180 [Asticcacaulis sp. SL142]
MAALAKALTQSHFKTTREVRNLGNLTYTSATSRVLNLSQVYVFYADDPTYKEQPFFENSQLNRAIILKHSLRVNERGLYHNQRRQVTKVILPFDPHDLRLGGRSFFIDQIGFDQTLKTYLNMDDPAKSPDVRILKYLDQLPSLDPFLVRDTLARKGVKPALCYLRLSSADLTRMASFTSAEIERLVLEAIGVDAGKASLKLGNKILSDKLDLELRPLQKALGMSDEEFRDGIFSWRGFLYYKWRHVELQDELREVLTGLGSYQPSGSFDELTKEYLRKARPRIARGVVDTLTRAGRTLHSYDTAYNALVKSRDPAPFRRFLFNGLSLFAELGESIGTLNHVSSFWSFRMQKTQNGRKQLSSAEFADIMMDFEASLAHAIKNRHNQNN